MVKACFLREPFVLVDVGVQGGEDPSWHRLGDYLIVHGFDAIEEAIEQLRKRTERVANRHYHLIAAGSADEERVFHFNPANPTASSMYLQGTSRFEVSANQQARSVTVRRLDTLFAEGLIPQADFLKVDVEGFEKDVLLGANNLLANVLAVETETNFGVSDAYPRVISARLPKSCRSTISWCSISPSIASLVPVFDAHWSARAAGDSDHALGAVGSPGEGSPTQPTTSAGGAFWATKPAAGQRLQLAQAPARKIRISFSGPACVMLGGTKNPPAGLPRRGSSAQLVTR